MQPAALLNPDDPNHQVVMFSTASDQASGRLVTRATPSAFAVHCLVDQIQREHMVPTAWAKQFPQDPDGLYLAMLLGQAQEALSQAVAQGES